MMNTLHFLKSRMSSLLRDRGGNFAMMTAILLPVTIGAAGVAIDVSNMLLSQRQLQEASDSAALAAATALANGKVSSHADAQALAIDFVGGQMANYFANDQTAVDSVKNATTVDVTETPNGTKSKIFSVSVNSSYNMPTTAFMRIFGQNNVRISTTSSSVNGQTDTQGALSMYLALDRSGSMSFITDTIKSQTTKCQNYTANNWGKYPNLKSTNPCYTRKIEALQIAATALFTALNAADTSTDHDLIRMGAVSYTDEMQTAKPINWGTGDASSYVTALPALPTGGTDASGAMQTAFNALKSSTDGSDAETVAHKSRDHTSFARYIILMTDGEMTGSTGSWNSPIDQDVRKVCAAAKADGIQIFTIAFMAPQKGKDLLSYCASSLSNAYQPDNMAKLVDDFGDIAAKATSSLTRLTN
jgi:Flp pilus assembly protein TadG